MDTRYEIAQSITEALRSIPKNNPNYKCIASIASSNQYDLLKKAELLSNMRSDKYISELGDVSESLAKYKLIQKGLTSARTALATEQKKQNAVIAMQGFGGAEPASAVKTQIESYIKQYKDLGEKTGKKYIEQRKDIQSKIEQLKKGASSELNDANWNGINDSKEIPKDGINDPTSKITGSAQQIKNLTVNIDAFNKGGINTQNTELQHMNGDQIADWFNNAMLRTIRNLEMSY